MSDVNGIGGLTFKNIFWFKAVIMPYSLYHFYVFIKFVFVVAVSVTRTRDI